MFNRQNSVGILIVILNAFGRLLVYEDYLVFMEYISCATQYTRHRTGCKRKAEQCQYPKLLGMRLR